MPNMGEFGSRGKSDIQWKAPVESFERKNKDSTPSSETEQNHFVVSDPVRGYIENLRMQRPDLSERDFAKIEKKLRKESSAYQKKETDMVEKFRVWLSQKKARLTSMLGIMGAVTSIGVGASHASGEHENDFSVHSESSSRLEHFSPIIRVGDGASQPITSVRIEKKGQYSVSENKELSKVEVIADELRGIFGDELVETIMSIETVARTPEYENDKIVVSGFENCPVFLSNEPMQRVVDAIQKHLKTGLRNVVYKRVHQQPPTSYGIKDESHEVVAYTDGDTITFYQAIDDMDPSDIESFLVHEMGHKVVEPVWDARATVLDRLEAAKAMAYYINKSEPTARLLPPEIDSTPTPEMPFDPTEKFFVSDYDSLIHNDDPRVEMVLRMKELYPELFRKFINDELSPDSPEEKLVTDALKISNPKLDIAALRADLIAADIQNEELLKNTKHSKIEKIVEAQK